MILPVHTRLREHLTGVIATLYSVEPSSLLSLALEYPPNRDLGDLGTPVAFELARRLRKAPRAIAQEIAAAFGTLEGIRQVAAAPNGYLNFFLERPAFLLDRLVPARSAPSRDSGKAIVEHTAINPNKAAHIGHLRNAALGDTLVRVLRFSGIPVEVQNYIDDTGVQVADVVVGFRVLEKKSLDRDPRDRRHARASTTTAGISTRASPSGTARTRSGSAIRAQTLHDIEHGGNENADIAAFIADRIVRCHLQTMARMNVDYDLLTWEGDILRLKFWAQAFEVLKAKGAVYLRTEGRLAGCWVMPIQEDLEATPNEPKSQRPNRANSQDAPGDRAADGEDDAKSARRSSSARTASSPTSARTSRISSGSSACSGAISTTASSRQRPQRSAVGDVQRRTARPSTRRSAARRTSTTSSTFGSRICRSC